MRLSLVAALLLLTIPSAGADELLGKEHVELTPFFGYRMGGHIGSLVGDRSYGIAGAKAYGGLLDVNLQASNFKLEFLWSHQETRLEGALFPGVQLLPLDIDHLQAGIMQEVGEPRARLSVSVLLGASRFSTPGLGSDTLFSGSVTGSAKLFPNPHIGIRLDARAYAVFVQGRAAAFCGGGCVLVYQGTALWQGEFTGGLILAF
jgi:hypothetical protein